MKRLLSILLALLMLLGAVPAMADTHNPLPEKIAALFDVPAWKEYEVMDWVWSESQNAAVVIMTNGKLHIVCIVEPDKDGALRITQRNYTMVVGNNGCSNLYEGYGNTSQEITLPWGYKEGFVLNTGDYMIYFAKFDGVWRIKVVLNGKDNVISFVYDDRIGYREGKVKEDYIDWEHNRMNYVHGTYDNRFAAFNLYAFPKTYKEAGEVLTNPPLTPTDFYTPVSVTLRPREKYDVFAAPGRSSYRAANGKAVMSTNDWVQIFGEEDGWVLVQYDISCDQMRFGYVDASVLPKGTRVQELVWYSLPEQTIKYGTGMTDDPLVSNNEIHRLNAGDKVRVLSTFGNWYYIETTNRSGKLLRGFVPSHCIDLVTDADMVG